MLFIRKSKTNSIAYYVVQNSIARNASFKVRSNIGHPVGVHTVFIVEINFDLPHTKKIIVLYTICIYLINPTSECFGCLTHV
jgi:hypothetical protein